MNERTNESNGGRESQGEHLDLGDAGVGVGVGAVFGKLQGLI
jgi:hypothetical protein